MRLKLPICVILYKPVFGKMLAGCLEKKGISPVNDDFVKIIDNFTSLALYYLNDTVGLMYVDRAS